MAMKTLAPECTQAKGNEKGSDQREIAGGGGLAIPVILPADAGKEAPC